LIFNLKVRCSRNSHASKDTSDPDELYKDHKGIELHTATCLENDDSYPGYLSRGTGRERFFLDKEQEKIVETDCAKPRSRQFCESYFH
jgi:hypothetical protein